MWQFCHPFLPPLGQIDPYQHVSVDLTGDLAESDWDPLPEGFLVFSERNCGFLGVWKPSVWKDRFWKNGLALVALSALFVATVAAQTETPNSDKAPATSEKKPAVPEEKAPPAKTPTKPPSHPAASTPQPTSKINLDTSETVFAFAAALNACGFGQEEGRKAKGAIP